MDGRAETVEYILIGRKVYLQPRLSLSLLSVIAEKYVILKTLVAVYEQIRLHGWIHKESNNVDLENHYSDEDNDVFEDCFDEDDEY